MRNCRNIWPDQVTVNSFLNLENIEVESCENLLHVFSLNRKERLEKLHQLQIVNCDSLEEIVEPHAVIPSAQSIVEETVTKFVFPIVTYLRFDKLPKLKGFHAMTHATEWPSLIKMEVIECPSVQIFALNCAGIGETKVATSNRPPLFQVNKV